MGEIKSPVRRKGQAEPVRRYAHLDAIAVQRQANDAKRREEEVRSAEMSMTAQPLNGMAADRGAHAFDGSSGFGGTSGPS